MTQQDIQSTADPFARTRGALAEFDAIESELDDFNGDHFDLDELFGRIGKARTALAEAFAADTADFNDPHTARNHVLCGYGMRHIRRVVEMCKP